MNQDNEKIYIYLAIAVIAIAFIFVLFIIWKPTPTDQKAAINYLDISTTYDEIQENNYKNILERLLMVNNYDELFERINTEWLEENNYTKDSLYNYLVEKGIISNNVPIIKDTVTINLNDDMVYRYQVQNAQGNLRYVIINEKNSNEFTISFEQENISKFEGKVYTYVEDGVTYTITTKAILENVVQYNLAISSQREDTITYDLSRLQNVYLDLDTGESYIPTDITSRTESVYAVEQNGTFDVDISFTLTLEKHSHIKSMSLYHVLDRDGEKTIKIDMLGGEE